ncbi:MAG: SpoVG family protein [Candidatus Omnitrophica bacterium]|nr:SpoVG family protein [Candidatus Omnitrophota bacterium]MBU1924673.1 SpoVG family protein [Candidatus Omnitrophota bacterium]
MEVTEVRVFLRNKDSNKKLKAYVTVTFDDCFVVRDVKVIEGSKGLFVAMPSAKMKTNCPKCAHRNVVRSNYCNQCGAVVEQAVRSGISAEDSRQNEHKDIAHPITPECREYIQKKVLEAYEESIGSSQTPGSSVRDDIVAVGDIEEEDTEI